MSGPLEPPPWMERAACADFPAAERDHVFFPGRGQSTRRAKAICGDCPVRHECLDYALENGFQFGIWGGTSERERRNMRRQRRLEAAS